LAMADSDDSDYDEDAELRKAIQMSLEDAAAVKDDDVQEDTEHSAETEENACKDSKADEIEENDDKNDGSVENEEETPKEKPQEGDWVWTKLGYGVVEEFMEKDGEECLSVKLKHGPPETCKLEEVKKTINLEIRSFAQIPKVIDRPKAAELENPRQKLLRHGGPPGSSGRSPDELIMGLSRFFEQSVSRPSRSDFSPGPWQCNRCTFINQQSVARCEMCGFVRPAPPKRTTHEGWVVHEVHSGNTLVLRNPETDEKKTCTLVGLNAPAVACGEGDKEDNFGHASRECLRRLTIGETVQHVSIEKQAPPLGADSSDDDPHEVEVVLEEGDSGEIMVQRGYCRCNAKGSAKYGEAERRARAAKVGMWVDNVNDDEHTRKITWSIEDDLAAFTAAHQDPVPAILESVMDISLFTSMLSLGNNNYQLLMFELAGIEMLGDDDTFGEEFQKYVENNWLNRSVIIRCVDVSPNDIITVELKTADGNNVYLACELLKRGFARILENNVTGIDNAVLELMQASQHEAVENQLHIWSQDASEEAEVDDKEDEDDQKMECDEEKEDEEEDDEEEEDEEDDENNEVDSAVPELGMDSSDEDDVDEDVPDPDKEEDDLPDPVASESNDAAEPPPSGSDDAPLAAVFNIDDSSLPENPAFQLPSNPPAFVVNSLSSGDYPVHPLLPGRSGRDGSDASNLPPPDLPAPRLSRSGQARLREVNLRRTELARKVAELRQESKDALGRFVMKMNSRESSDSGSKKKEKKPKMRISDYTPPSKVVPMKVEHNGILSFDLPVTETLQSIRDKIVDKFKVSKDAVRLLHRGKDLTEWHKSIAQLNIHAPEELFFIVHQDSSTLRFDSTRCGDQMQISEDGMSATSLTHGQWYVAISSRSFNHGRHSWTFRIDKIGKPGFIGFGVCQETASLTTWLGNGANSCGILGDGVRWARGSRHPSVRSQIFFRESDLVTIDLDMDTRLMAVLRNGSTISHSYFVDLPDSLYPAVCLYEKGDSVTLVDQKYNLPSNVRIFRSIKNLKLVLECTRKACEPFNLYPGDQVMLSNEKQTGTVIGASLLPTQGVIYVHVPGRDGLLGHNRPSCSKHVKIYRRANARLSLQTRIRPAIEDSLCCWTLADEEKSSSARRLPPR